MRYFLIMNPGSRGGRSKRQFERIFALLAAAGVEYDYRITGSLEDAYHLSVEANEAGYDVVVAVGGDGTLNRVLNGFYTREGRRRSQAKLGVLYTGTSPDFCKSYGIPTDLNAAIDVLLQGESSFINVGMITLAREWRGEYEGRGIAPDDKLFHTRYFACCANIGLGAALARNANSGIRKWVGDHPGTFLALLKTLVTYRPGNFTVCRDGVETVLYNVHTISVGRTYYIASGIKVRHELQPADGRLYNLIVENMHFRDVPRVFKQIYSGQQIISDEVTTLCYSKTLEIYGSRKNPEVEFDGDPAGYLPCRISLALEPLELIRRGDANE